MYTVLHLNKYFVIIGSSNILKICFHRFNQTTMRRSMTISDRIGQWCSSLKQIWHSLQNRFVLIGQWCSSLKQIWHSLQNRFVLIGLWCSSLKPIWHSLQNRFVFLFRNSSHFVLQIAKYLVHLEFENMYIFKKFKIHIHSILDRGSNNLVKIFDTKVEGFWWWWRIWNRQ